MIKPSVVGQTEMVDLPELGVSQVPAKVDTGADSSSIWASKVKETADGLSCTFFGEDSPFYTGKPLQFRTGYSRARIANSFGQKQFRYKIKLSLKVQGRQIRTTFTLADRSTKTYPILLGRSLLKGKFIVDVSKGKPAEDIKPLSTKREKI